MFSSGDTMVESFHGSGRNSLSTSYLASLLNTKQKADSLEQLTHNKATLSALAKARALTLDPGGLKLKASQDVTETQKLLLKQKEETEARLKDQMGELLASRPKARTSRSYFDGLWHFFGGFSRR